MPTAVGLPVLTTLAACEVVSLAVGVVGISDGRIVMLSEGPRFAGAAFAASVTVPTPRRRAKSE